MIKSRKCTFKAFRTLARTVTNILKILFSGALSLRGDLGGHMRKYSSLGLKSFSKEGLLKRASGSASLS